MAMKVNTISFIILSLQYMSYKCLSIFYSKINK